MPKSVDKSLLFRLIAAGHLARMQAQAPLTELGLQPGDDAILLALNEEEGARLADLSEATGLPALLLTERLVRFSAEDLVDGAADPNRLTLTPRGVAYAQRIAGHWQSLEDLLSANLKHAEAKALRRALKKMADRLDEN